LKFVTQLRSLAFGSCRKHLRRTYRKPSRTRRSRMSVRHACKSIFCLAWPLSFDPQSLSLHALARWTSCANWHQNRFILFQNIVFTSLLTDKRKNGRTNG